MARSSCIAVSFGIFRRLMLPFIFLDYSVRRFYYKSNCIANNDIFLSSELSNEFFVSEVYHNFFVITFGTSCPSNLITYMFFFWLLFGGPLIDDNSREVGVIALDLDDDGLLLLLLLLFVALDWATT